MNEEKKEYNFKELSDLIFNNRENYKYVSDSSIEKNFFIINRKLSFQYPRQANFLNDSTVDPIIGMSLWINFLNSKKINYTPRWWYTAKANYGKKKLKINAELQKIMQYEELTEEDMVFLNEHYKDELDYEVKKYKKFK